MASRRGLLGSVIVAGSYLVFGGDDPLGGGGGGTIPVDLGVSTLEPEGVDWESATLAGELEFIDGTSRADVLFEYYKVDGDDVIETSTERVSEPAEFYRAINGLDPETEYAAIALAEANGTIAEGSLVEFATEAEPSIEVVTTDTVDEIGEEQARLYGEVVDMTNTDEANAYFEYRPKTDEERQDSEIVVVSEPQTYDVLLEGLEPATEYEGRAKAIAADRDDVVDYGEFVNWETEGPDIPDSAIAHYDAQALSGDDGDAVSTWPDELGDYDATGGSPVIRDDGINGHRALEFDASSGDNFTASIGTRSQPNTVFAVVELDDSTDYRSVMDSNGSERETVFWSSSDGWNIFAGNNSPDGSTDTSVQLLSGLFDGSNSNMREDGTESTTGDAGSDGLVDLTIAGDSDQGRTWSGYLGELVICDGAVTGSERDSYEQDLADKWGITL